MSASLSPDPAGPRDTMSPSTAENIQAAQLTSPASDLAQPESPVSPPPVDSCTNCSISGDQPAVDSCTQTIPELGPSHPRNWAPSHQSHLWASSHLSSRSVYAVCAWNVVLHQLYFPTLLPLVKQ